DQRELIPPTGPIPTFPTRFPVVAVDHLLINRAVQPLSVTVHCSLSRRLLPIIFRSGLNSCSPLTGASNRPARFFEANFAQLQFRLFANFCPKKEPPHCGYPNQIKRGKKRDFTCAGEFRIRSFQSLCKHRNNGKFINRRIYEKTSFTSIGSN